MSKIRMDTSGTNRDQAHGAATYVKDMTRSMLERAEHMAPEDRVVTEQAIEALSRSLTDLDQVIGHIPETSRIPDALYEIVTKLVLGSFMAGCSSIFGPEAKQWRGAVKAMDMRNARREQPQEIALREAVEAELAGRPVTKANKEANAILGGVNVRLEAAGFLSVKVDVIRRRLEKKALS